MDKIVKTIKILKKNKKKSMLMDFRNKSKFYILIATVLSARNRDEQTIKAVKKLFSVYKSPKEISLAPIKELEKLIKLSGTYKQKARRIKELSKLLITEYSGRVPSDYDELLKLPGVGRKTAGCVVVYAFEKDAIPVDTHVHRISNRLGWIKTKTREESEFELMKVVPRKYWQDVNEVLVVHGQTICKPINPMCEVCPVFDLCAYRTNKL
jgi:endonuclease-3